jgi:hypothetical protein
VCPLCQAEFLEFKTVCTHCGVALLDPSDDTDPRHLPEDEQLIYDLSAWPLDAQTDAAQLLAESGLPHVWLGTDLLMPLVHEQSGDRLLERIEREYGLGSAEETDSEGETDDDLDGAATTDDADDDTDADESEDPEESAPAHGDTEYDLSGWEAWRRKELVERLVEESVPHRWEGDLLVVSTREEPVVDHVLDLMEGAGPDDEDDDEDDDADVELDEFEVDGVEVIPVDESLEVDVTMDPAEIMSGLFLASERMRKGKVDVDTYGGLLASLESAEPEQPPYGIDGELWRRVLAAGDDLADAVADDADDVEDLASELYNLLRPYI